MRDDFNPLDFPTDDEVADLIRSVPRHFVDLTVTATSVEKYSGAATATAPAGETITAGQTVFKDAVVGSATLGKLLKTDVNDGTRHFCDGIALNGGALNQPVQYQTGGDIDVGATLAVGMTYVPSATQGGIAPITDVTTGWRVIIFGVASATDKLKLISGFFKPGVTSA